MQSQYGVTEHINDFYEKINSSIKYTPKSEEVNQNDITLDSHGSEAEL